MLNVLFDVAKTVSLREFEDDDLFLIVMEIVSSFLSLDLDAAGLARTELIGAVKQHEQYFVSLQTFSLKQE